MFYQTKVSARKAVSNTYFISKCEFLQMQSVSILAVLALAFTCTLAFDAKLNHFWTQWKNTHNKVYSSVEDTARFVVSFFLIESNRLEQ